MIETTKFELNLLKQPAGKIIAENTIKKNQSNYHIYYPEKANKYTEKAFNSKENEYEDPAPEKMQIIDPMKVNPHILMKAVDR